MDLEIHFIKQINISCSLEWRDIQIRIHKLYLTKIHYKHLTCLLVWALV